MSHAVAAADAREPVPMALTPMYSAASTGWPTPQPGPPLAGVFSKGGKEEEEEEEEGDAGSESSVWSTPPRRLPGGTAPAGYAPSPFDLAGEVAAPRGPRVLYALESTQPSPLKVEHGWGGVGMAPLVLEASTGRRRGPQSVVNPLALAAAEEDSDAERTTASEVSSVPTPSLREGSRTCRVHPAPGDACLSPPRRRAPLAGFCLHPNPASCSPSHNRAHRARAQLPDPILSPDSDASSIADIIGSPCLWQRASPGRACRMPAFERQDSTGQHAARDGSELSLSIVSDPAGLSPVLRGPARGFCDTPRAARRAEDSSPKSARGWADGRDAFTLGEPVLAAPAVPSTSPTTSPHGTVRYYPHRRSGGGRAVHEQEAFLECLAPRLPSVPRTGRTVRALSHARAYAEALNAAHPQEP